MSIINRFFSFIEARTSSPSLSYWRTAYLNLRTLPFAQAIKFPLRVYGRIRLACLDGSIIIPENTTLKIGLNFAGFRHSGPGQISIMKNGRMILGKDIQISQGASIHVHNNATLELKDYSHIGDRTSVICYKGIKIGQQTRIAWDSQLTDSNFHFICLENKIINPIINPIHIGDNCWIGNRTTIMPGSSLPDRTIVASNSLINKDYTSLIPNYSLIAGSPAKLKRTDTVRIYDRRVEAALNEYFRSHNKPLVCENFSSMKTDDIASIIERKELE